MSKIKIAFYACDIDYAGTWRSHERIIKHLDNSIFESSILYWEHQDQTKSRLAIARDILKETEFIPFKRSKMRRGKDKGYAPWRTDFHKVAANKFDIIHFARSGHFEWPFTSRLAPVQIETNIFGSRDTSPFLDKSIAICNYISKKRGASDGVIYNPIPKAKLEGPNFREEFGIAKNTTVLAGLEDPIQLFLLPLLWMRIQT